MPKHFVSAHSWTCILILLASVIPSSLVAAATVSKHNLTNSPRPSVSALVLYDNAAPSGGSDIVAHHVYNLLGHFECTRTIQPVSSMTTPSEVLSKHDAVFLCEIPATAISNSLLDALSLRRRTTCWLRGGIDRLLAREPANQRGFMWSGPVTQNVDFVRYNGTLLPKNVPGLNLIEILDPRLVEVRATAVTGLRELPFVIQRGSDWFVAGPTLSGQCHAGHGLVFADLLHDILTLPHESCLQALVRLEDISAHSSPADLRRAADALARRRIPFQMAVIPFFKDPEKGVSVSLTDRPEVCEAIRYMVARGGSVVLHGITHQRTGISGIDFEFWDPAKGIPDLSLDHGQTYRLIERGISECFRAQIYPIAWETPHYAAGEELYKTVAEMFSHVYERRMVSGQPLHTEGYPYVITDRLGQHVIPENLGYIPIDKPAPSTILAAAARLRAVRDPIASFFFHPFMPVALLEQAVDGIQAQGYTFTSVTSLECCRLNTRDFVVSTGPGSLPWSSPYPYRQTATQAPGGILTMQTESSRLENIVLRPPSNGLVAIRGVPLDIQAGQAVPNRFFRSTGPNSPVVACDDAVLLTTSSPAVAADSEQRSFESLLQILSLPYQAVPSSDLDTSVSTGSRLWVIPRNVAETLPPKALAHVRQQVAMGDSLILVGQSALALTLGFSFDGGSTQVHRVRDCRFPSVDITWQSHSAVKDFQPPPYSTPLAHDADSGRPLVMLSSCGAGRVIFLGVDLDPVTGDGYARFPHLPHHIRENLGIRAPVQDLALEYYFDPGFRQDQSIEQLVREWHQDGIRAVYAAAWHFYPKWNYDYPRLIRLCRERGIAVYAWFELPMVSNRMWQDHPEWRDKTASGRDANVGWRRLMNMANADCFQATLAFVNKLLRDYDWDGVNIAEFCFDTGNGIRDPDTYVPMNDNIRQTFIAEAGFDPILLLDGNSPRHWQTQPVSLRRWEAHRSRLLRDRLHDIIHSIAGTRPDRPLDIIVTTLDSILTPDVTDLTGTDSRDVIALMNDHNFTLQVEDPASCWGDSPRRYETMGKIYRALVPDPQRLMFDINVVTSRTSRLAPTVLAQGTELAVAVRAAGMAGNRRVAIYSEASLLPEDRPMIADIQTGQTSVSATLDSVTIHTTGPAWLRLDTPVIRRLLQNSPGGQLCINGRQLPQQNLAQPSYPLEPLPVPAGRYRLTVSPAGFWGEALDSASRLSVTVIGRFGLLGMCTLGLLYGSRFFRQRRVSLPPATHTHSRKPIPKPSEKI